MNVGGRLVDTRRPLRLRGAAKGLACKSIIKDKTQHQKLREPSSVSDTYLPYFYQKQSANCMTENALFTACQ